MSKMLEIKEVLLNSGDLIMDHAHYPVPGIYFVTQASTNDIVYKTTDGIIYTMSVIDFPEIREVKENPTGLSVEETLKLIAVSKDSRLIKDVL